MLIVTTRWSDLKPGIILQSQTVLAKEFDIRKQSYLEQIYCLLKECHVNCILLPLNTLQILLTSKCLMAI